MKNLDLSSEPSDVCEGLFTHVSAHAGMEGIKLYIEKLANTRVDFHKEQIKELRDICASFVPYTKKSMRIL